MTSKSLSRIFLISGSILIIPFVAMQFTSEVNWTLGDFLVAATLLVGAGILISYIRRKIKNQNKLFVAILLILATLFLVWAELAVGIFNSPFAGS